MAVQTVMVTVIEASTLDVVCLTQVDLLYMQNLRSIAEIHETGVTAENFHEVSGLCLVFAPFIFNEITIFCAFYPFLLPCTMECTHI